MVETHPFEVASNPALRPTPNGLAVAVMWGWYASPLEGA